jgi:hypothetical protein
MKTRLLLPLALSALTACAPAGAGAAAPRAGSNLITLDEISRTGAQNAYQVVESLRPAWLRTRGVQSLSESTHTGGRDGRGAQAVAGDGGVTIPNAGRPQVIAYLGTMRLGPIASLREIPVADVGSIRFLSPAQATHRFGANHTHGAIVVELRAR